LIAAKHWQAKQPIQGAGYLPCRLGRIGDTQQSAIRYRPADGLPPPDRRRDNHGRATCYVLSLDRIGGEMSKYLDMLKQLDEKFSLHTPESELTKPPKAPFVSFGGTGTWQIEKIIIDKDALAESVMNGGIAWMWQIILSHKALVVTTTPASTMAEMDAMYPGAIKIEVIE
jgi:hypothetical protein